MPVEWAVEDNYAPKEMGSNKQRKNAIKTLENACVDNVNIGSSKVSIKHRRNR